MSSIIFMGTPEFAVPTLESLIESEHEIKLVVTQPDRPANRGQKLTPPPVKVLAEKYGIQVLQPGSLKKDSEEKQKLLNTECDFLVVAAFGQILPQEVLDHPRIAPLNVHASLLPNYRGAAPINRSIIEGESETGVTIQWMVKELDMGDILVQLPCPIQEHETAQELHDHLKGIGAQALIQSLKEFADDRIQRKPQDPRIGSYAPKLSKDEARIDFRQPAFIVHRKIMGLSPWPGAECRLAGQRLKVYRSKFVARMPNADPGTVIDTQDDAIVVACEDACIGLLEVQMENRKRLSAPEFVRGQSLPKGMVLGGV